MKPKSRVCDRNGDNDIKAFNLESRIQQLERVVAKLKAARFGPKV